MFASALLRLLKGRSLLSKTSCYLKETLQVTYEAHFTPQDQTMAATTNAPLVRPPGFIFLISMATCDGNLQHMYELGGASNVIKRLHESPEGSVILLQLPVSVMSDAETKLITMCRTKFKHYSNTRNPYFEGDLVSIMRTLLEVADQFRPYDVVIVGDKTMIIVLNEQGAVVDTDLVQRHNAKHGNKPDGLFFHP